MYPTQTEKLKVLGCLMDVNEVRVEGESRIPEVNGRVRRVWLEPNDAPAFPPVIRALLRADMIVIGPGSLYTSLLPNLLVRCIFFQFQIWCLHR